MKALCLPLYLFLLVNPTRCTKQESLSCDICIYGGTSSGVIAALAADRLGKSVILVEPGNHLGGLSSGGLGATDIGNKFAITGMARDFYREIGKAYDTTEQWIFEPHVAELLFNRYIDSSGVRIFMQSKLVRLIRTGKRIEQIITVASNIPGYRSRRRIRAKVFIDCSYEGDMMYLAKVNYTIGREDNRTYGESLNGVQLKDKHQFPDSVDPWIVPGNPGSGLVWGIQKELPEPMGTGDRKVQAYNFRLCLTRDTSNFIAIKAPEKYERSWYELLARLIRLRMKKGEAPDLGQYMHIQMMPGGKTDINNNGAFSTDMINESWNYAEASYRGRQNIKALHEKYIKGFLYFLGHDTAVPVELRNQMLSWGYTRDEFTDNNGFPHQMYIRESRRMVGEYVMSERNCRGIERVEDGIGMAAYTMDSHNCQRIVLNGMVKNEGDVQVGGFPPYPVSYRSIIPKKSECQNLLVPVCLSASHIAYGSIRMEPVFMVLGQSAALAAELAIERHCAVQEVPYNEIQSRLKSDPLFNGKSLSPADSVFVLHLQ
jgi:hypothetical protein